MGMKAMKAKAGATKKTAKTMSVSAACSALAATTGLKAKVVKGVVANYIELAADQLKKNGTFKIAGAMNLKLKKKDAKPARKGVNPFTKEPCVFKAKPASKTVKALPMKKLKDMMISKELLRSRWAVSPGPN